MEIKEFISSNKHKNLKIVVFGDCMIDDYKYGHVDRVSPEFPVPILTSHKDSSEQYPGGAGNVCLQMKHFNVDVSLIGFVDSPAITVYKQHKLNIQNCVELVHGFVPRKVRFYDSDFPLHRWDIEQPEYGEEQSCLGWMRAKAYDNFKKHLTENKIDAVILSDYNKGFWTDEFAQDVINLCNANGIMTIVDPKKSLYRWVGCTIFKPNANEAKILSGRDEVSAQINYLQNKLLCKGVVITQSGKGVVGKYQENHFEHLTSHKLSDKEVNSVIGAGDCFAAVMTIALSHGFDLKQSCAFAFEAGVQYVKARHNKPISLYDIHSRIDKISAKIVDVEDLHYLRNNVYNNEEFVFTNGCFDILHQGHLDTLKFAKSKGTKLIVGLNSDISVKILKGEDRPICNFQERSNMLASLEYVDFVVPFDTPTPMYLIKALEPDYLVKGGDYSEDNVVGAEYVKKVFIAPTREGYSTTGFIKKLGLNS